MAVSYYQHHTEKDDIDLWIDEGRQTIQIKYRIVKNRIVIDIYHRFKAFRPWVEGKDFEILTNSEAKPVLMSLNQQVLKHLVPR